MDHPQADGKSNREPVESLMDEFAAQIRDGQDPSVEDWARKHPQYAEEIQELFPYVAMMEQLRRSERGSHAPGGHRPPSLDGSSHIAGNRIVREIGRGGMGVVYEAVQGSLGRHVAVKVISNDSVSTRRVSRFDLEAQVAARLHHTNIVPVFEAGSEDGISYYVMQYIQGASLDRVLSSLRDLLGHTPNASEDKVGSNTASSSSVRASRTAASIARSLQSGDITNSSCTATDSRDGGGVSDEAEPRAHQETANPSAANRRFLGLGAEYYRNVARIGLQTAGALQYAHNAGVLHRDVKPSNLLLEPHGVVWVADFGLAKLTEGDESAASENQVGTPRYMAPEMFEGKCDERSDVYGLGLTLYELATTRVAHESRAVSEGSGDGVRQVPKRPRAHNREIPRDLEAIILKSTEADPARRYATAAALADDLRRFLEGRTVSVTKTTYAKEIALWSRRNPVTALASAVAAVALILVAVLATVGNVRIAKALDEAHSAREDAEAHLELAIEGFEEVFSKVSMRGQNAPMSFELTDEEGAQQLDESLTTADADLLESLLAFYGELVQRHGDDDRLRVVTAEAHRRVGEIHSRLNQLPNSEGAFESALEIYRDLAREHPHELRYTLQCARLWNELGLIGGRRHRYREQSDAHREARELLLDQSETFRREESLRYELGRTCQFLGCMWSPPRRPFTPQRGPGGATRRETNDGSGRNSTRDREGSSSRGIRTAGENLALAIELFQELLAEDPSHREYRMSMALCRRQQMRLAVWTGRLSEAIEHAEASQGIFESLSRDYPQDPNVLYELAFTLALMGRELSPSDALDCEDSLRRASQMARRLTSAFPHETKYQMLRVRCYGDLAAICEMDERYSDAESHRLGAIDRLQLLVEHNPGNWWYQYQLARERGRLGDFRRQRGLQERNRSLVEDAAAIIEQALQDYVAYRRASKRSSSSRLTSSLERSLAESREALEELDASAATGDRESTEQRNDPASADLGDGAADPGG